MAVVFYVTGHGFGHAVRQIAIVNALAQRRPDVSDRGADVGRAVALRAQRPRVRPPRAGPGRHRRHPARQPRRRHPGDAGGRAGVLCRRRRLDRARSGVPDRRARPAGGRGHPAAADRRGAAGRRARPSASRTSPGTGSTRTTTRGGWRPGLVETLEAHYASRRRGLAPADVRRLRQLRDAARPAARRPAWRASRATIVRAALGLPADRPLVLVSLGGYGARGIDLHARRRVAARRGRRRRHVVRRVRAGQRRPPHRRNGDVRPAASATRTWSAPSTSSPASRATGSSRSAPRTARRCSTRTAAASASTTCWCGRCRATWRRRSSARRTCGRAAGATPWRDLLARPPRPPAPAEGATTAADWLSARLDRGLARRP